MADVAHDASGQVSRPDSPDKGKLRVFISYSRDDLYFANQLNAALDICGFECFIDREGISGGEDWKRRLGNLIRDADTVVFVLSPTSARSGICAWEVEEAARLGKRILPVACRPLKDASPPPRLRDLNYIFFYEDPKVSDSGFGTGLASLVAALNTDFDWLREHTRYLQRATEWDRGGRPANRLLSGDDVAEAKAWVASRPKNAPEPTALHSDFIRASEEEAEARLSAQRKQLEAMAAAHVERETALHKAEEALKQAADAQRKRAMIIYIAFVTVSLIAVFAGWLYWAEKQGKEQVLAVIETAATHGEAFSMGRLADIYHWGQFGVAQDFAKAAKWYEKAANHGDAFSMGRLAQIYDLGQFGGVAQDFAKAREWYEKAAEKGDTFAMYRLGVLYEFGWGGAHDFTKAREWYDKAAAKGDADAMARLEQLTILEANEAGHYAEALRLAQALAVRIEEAETKRQGKAAKETAQALDRVAWYALFAREFRKALNVANRAHALYPDNLPIEADRAHALMFLERGEDAKALYLAHKGEPLLELVPKLWEQAIVRHFVRFREAGLTHPMMADIEKELGVSQ
jgi:TPR repeat protein